MVKSDPIAEFLARGGKIQRIPEGKGNLNLTEKEWYSQLREPMPVRRDTGRNTADGIDAEGNRVHYSEKGSK